MYTLCIWQIPLRKVTYRLFFMIIVSMTTFSIVGYTYEKAEERQGYAKSMILQIYLRQKLCMPLLQRELQTPRTNEGSPYSYFCSIKTFFWFFIKQKFFFKDYLWNANSKSTIWGKLLFRIYLSIHCPFCLRYLTWRLGLFWAMKLDRVKNTGDSFDFRTCLTKKSLLILMSVLLNCWALEFFCFFFFIFIKLVCSFYSITNFVYNCICH